MLSSAIISYKILTIWRIKINDITNKISFLYNSESYYLKICKSPVTCIDNILKYKEASVFIFFKGKKILMSKFNA